jgi:hypothetical protein
MAFNCFGVSGCASGSDFAAAVIALSSFDVGMAMERRLDNLDIVFYLATIGSAQADDPSHLTTIHKSHVVEDPGLRRERDHAQLVGLKSVINPNQRSIPIEFACQCQRDAVLRSVRGVFGWIKLDSHTLL